MWFETRKEIDLSIRACGYVRKSRKSEKRSKLLVDPVLINEEIKEDLARQESLLYKLAEREGVVLSHIFREVVSGETLQERPEALAMLQGVWAGEWDAIFTVEVERLGRGNQIDQGRIVTALRHSTQNNNGRGAKVVTINKTYYPNNEEDMAAIEFGLFLSARELGTIKRRLNYGKLTSVMEGEFIATHAPYGYDKQTIHEKKSLVINKDSFVVRFIYNLVASGISSNKVASYLNYMLIPSSNHGSWSGVTVRKIINNDAYTGYVTYGKNKTVVVTDENLNMQKRRRLQSDYVKVRGIHAPIVSESIARQARVSLRNNVPLIKSATLINPYAGLIKCSKCGANLGPSFNKRSGEYRLVHRSKNKNCDSPSVSFFDAIESIDKQIEMRLKKIKSDLTSAGLRAKIKKRESRINDLSKKIALCDESLMSAFDLLDRDIITEKEFRARRNEISHRKSILQAKLNKILSNDVKKILEAQCMRLTEIQKAQKKNTDLKELNRLYKVAIKEIIFSCDAKPYTRNPAFEVEIILIGD